MRTIMASVIWFATLSVCTCGAQAAPWCAHFNTGLNACSFYSFQQCMAVLSGNGGMCSPNQFETPYRASRGPGGSYQRGF
jgi:hypothetical protein